MTDSTIETARTALAASHFGGNIAQLRPAPNSVIDRNAVYFFEQDGIEYVLKLFEQSSNWRNERAALKRLSGYFAPAIIDAGGGEMHWLVMTRLPRDEAWTCSPGFPSGAFRECGQALAQMHRSHRLDCYGSLWDLSQQTRSWWAYVDKAFADGLYYLQSHAIQSRAMLSRVQALYATARTRLVIDEPVPVLIHRDLGVQNLCFGRIPNWTAIGVIDFEHAIAGDARLDLCRLQDEVLESQPNWAIEFWEGYDPDGLMHELELSFVLYRILRCVRGIRFGIVHRDGTLLRENLDLLTILNERGIT